MARAYPGWIVRKGAADARIVRAVQTRLGELGTTVVRLGNPEDAAKMDQLMANFQSVGLKVIGPTAEHLAECRRLVQQTDEAVFEELENLFNVDGPVDVANIYRSLAAPTDAGVAEPPGGGNLVPQPRGPGAGPAVGQLALPGP